MGSKINNLTKEQPYIQVRYRKIQLCKSCRKLIIALLLMRVFRNKVDYFFKTSDVNMWYSHLINVFLLNNRWWFVHHSIPFLHMYNTINHIYNTIKVQVVMYDKSVTEYKSPPLYYSGKCKFCFQSHLKTYQISYFVFKVI